LAPDAQVALTLREVCGLTTEEVAAAFLTPAPTTAQRIVRAKSKIRDAGIPYEVPAREHLPARLESVLRVVYLVFNEGYLASRGESATRADLSGEAVRLCRLILELMPEPEVRGLLALMLLHDSRREARADEEGELVLLDEQDRTRWNLAMIEEGSRLVREALSAPRPPGPYAIQAAIAAAHAEAPTPADTDWREIVGLYDILMALVPSPIVALNRAVALAMRDGPEIGLAQLDALLAGGELDRYQLAHAARADFCRRLGRNAEASAAYARAIELTEQGPARRFLEKRLAALR
jgi:RNA polymerase sigma-70 factor (ECF subfamily)